MRPNQHNKRSRGRNRHRGSSSGGGGGSGGNPLNRVYESNGPDVKVRGTAQTIAEKYLQLGRDAQSSGDTVMSESYFQHAEHYLRILAAAQAYNQQMQQQYRRPGEEFDDEDGEDGDYSADSEDASAASGEHSEQPAMHSEQSGDEDFRPPPPPQQHSRDNRRDRDRDRDYNRNNNRQRYDNRRDHQQDQPRDYQQAGEQPQAQPPVRQDEQPVIEDGATPAAASGSAGWEAPSFLRKPAANGSTSGRPRTERRPRREAEGNSTSAVTVTSDSPAEGPAAEVPQGE